jgi:hypothetical protein
MRFVPPQNALTRLRQLAIDLGRLADALEAETEFDPTIFHQWHDQLLDIAAELDGSRPAASG